ncbi:MAG: AraC family transcriptional regulator [Candidatus Delongbacteria bacterium]|nr:AraC family transcriptional regulator [Candidatus Delongbacteria bacterium]
MPSPLLADYVRYYWIFESDDIHHQELVYPTGEVQILFHYRQPFRRVEPDGRMVPQSAAEVGGQTDTFRRIMAEPVCGLIGVTFHPHAASAFIPFPLFEIRNSGCDVSDFHPGLGSFSEQLAECPDSNARIALIERFLLSRLNAPPQYSIIRHMVNKIIKSHGQIELSALYQEAGWSERHFQRIFRSRIGISPKRFLEIIRFNHAVSLLAAPFSLTRIAYDAGYYDQSHLIKAFREFSSLNPMEFRRLNLTQ